MSVRTYFNNNKDGLIFFSSDSKTDKKAISKLTSRSFKGLSCKSEDTAESVICLDDSRCNIRRLLAALKEVKNIFYTEIIRMRKSV